MSINRLTWLLSTSVVFLAGCTVDPGPSATACDAEGRCRDGFVCEASTNTCVMGVQRISVALAGAGSGTVVSTPPGIDCGATCTLDVDYGTTLTLEATPDSMSSFAGWEGDCSGTGSCMVLADHAVSVTATFARQVMDLNVTKPGRGEGTVTSMPTGIDCGATCTAGFDIGTRVTLVAEPAPGSTFEGWTGDCTGTGVCALTMDVPHEVSAAFSPGGLMWALGFGGTGFDSATSVVVDAAGDVIVAGYFMGSVDFGGETLVAAGAEDVFVAKYAGTDGSRIWSVRYGGTDADQTQALAVDGDGNIIVGGFYEGTLDLGDGPRTSAGGFDLFIVKLSGADGSPMWSRLMGAGGTDGAFDLAVDSAGDIVMVGNYQSPLDFGSGTPLVPSGLFDGFAAKYRGTDGGHVWSTTLGGGGGTDFAEGVVIRDDDNPVVAGTFGGAMVAGSTTLTAIGNTDTYLVEFGAASGSPVRAFSYGGSGFEYGTALAIDPGDGGLLFTAAFEGTAVFGGMPLVSAGFLDLAVAKHTATGTHLWSTGFGGTGNDYIYGVVAPRPGEAAVIGSFHDSFELGHTLTSAGEDDVLVATFDDEGIVIWSRGFGGPGVDLGLNLTADTSGALYAVGTFEDTFELEGETLTSNGMGDAFLIKLGN